MRITTLLLVGALMTLTPVSAFAKAKAKGGAAKVVKTRGQAPSARAMGELVGKFKWGMSPDDILKVLGDDLDAKYVELIKKESDTYKQDLLRKQKGEDLAKVKESLVKFDGKKSGWDSSI